MIQVVECPRDAMQGISEFISTEKKAEYINMLLKVGFHTVDFGSFVSPKAIPQMRDTADVLSRLDVDQTDSKLLAIVANKRGALEACSFDQITYLGYPFSVSETFQQRNTNRSIESSLLLVEELQNVCLRKNKTLVVYLSMAFGNPYGEVWDVDMIAKWTHFLTQMGVKVIALSDTIGISSKATVTALFSQLIPEFSEVTFGAHLHTTAQNWKENVLAAYQAGCTRFDSAIKGYGGCPMAKDELTGNMPTEKLLSFFNEQKEDAGLNAMAFESAYNKALEIFR
ncbi:hydroxymethylglutaryl-CoA lyase [Flavobacteriales bacterium]|jgi:hydroxymethylglutaryl-CoA lyase|nr:hydroxymethylglutaryl-CoA lyase [Flavobacteriales bacterium]